MVYAGANPTVLLVKGIAATDLVRLWVLFSLSWAYDPRLELCVVSAPVQWEARWGAEWSLFGKPMSII